MRVFNRPPWVVLAATACLSAFLSACGGAPDEGVAIHRGNRLEPGMLDPAKAIIMDERTIVADLFVGLYEPLADGTPRLGLAESVEISDDGLVWTFSLREANWSDGVPITADDVVFGLQRTLDPATGNQYAAPLFPIRNAASIYMGEAEVETLGAAALDARTVEIALEYPTPYLPSILMYWGQPQPRHAIDAHGDDWMRPENLVVSGAYRMTDRRTGNFIRLEANPQFHDADQICADTIYYYPTVDTASAERRVRSGELDLNVEFSAANTDFLRERAPDLVQTVPGLYIRAIDFNTASEPFDNGDVRRALSLAIDRRFIANDILGGDDLPAWRQVPEGIPGRPDGVGLDFADQPMEARRAEARALLEAAGFGPDNPLRFTLYYQPAAGWPRIVPVIQQDWRLIADWVEAEVQVRDSQIHYQAMRGGDFQVATTAWVPDFLDPYGVLLQWETRAGEINNTRWNSAEYDALTDAALNTVDPVRRAELYAQAEQMFLDSHANIPVFFEATRKLVSPRITGWVTNAAGINQSRWLCTVEAGGAE
ncbi:peptide ABC transporter substrate-binding protein [Maricaulis parjimensis]|uniref:peptide ABC transporter substrate-binding protein n=1 Tax=Maricaulis parjimensis TaxID=144023 RepID=UPI0019399957|nr:peptide ABC transporter substrate-binding protein [Maricaulis parjimensis]